MAKKTPVANQSLAIATVENVPEVLQLLDRKLEEMREIETCAWKAGSNLSGFGNIREEKLVDNLYRAYSSVYARNKAYEEGMADLGKSEYPLYKQDGYTLEEWKHDILLRERIINQKDTLDKLKEYRDRASKFLSQEDQKAMLFREMEAFLGK